MTTRVRLLAQAVGARAGLFPKLLVTLVIGTGAGQGQAPLSEVPNLPSAGRLRVAKTLRLTDDPAHYLRPAWSPDGQWIAFARDGFAGIEVMRADGSERRILVVEPGAGYKFAWSPDGQEIAFRATDERDGLRQYFIKSVQVRTGKVRLVSGPRPEMQPPQWDVGEAGQRIAFMAGTQRVNTAWTKLKATSRKPALGDALLYYREGNVWWCRGDGKEHKPLTTDGGLEPVWSPDRTRIVFSRVNSLMVMNADGTGVRELARGHHPAWAPDSEKLVFEVAHDDGHRITSSDLYVINADGTELTQLTETPEALEVEPCWSPDGRQIVYRLEDSGQIWVLTLTW